MKDELSDRRLSFEEVVSQKEDTDMAEAIPKLYIYQSAYQALLNSFARITSVNLFDIIG
jgi:flagellin-like hook-associated protein FlgL